MALKRSLTNPEEVTEKVLGISFWYCVLLVWPNNQEQH